VKRFVNRYKVDLYCLVETRVQVDNFGCIKEHIFQDGVLSIIMIIKHNLRKI
jgi:hypothetical protein